MAEFDTVAIVGVGLIGGSIGLALRERKLARQVIGIGRDEAKLAAAFRLGAIDAHTTNLAHGVEKAQLVVVCTPVDSIADMVSQAAGHCANRTLITDAGSTKAKIAERVGQLLIDRRDGPRFVGSHPLAGDHRTGVDYARADLFDGRKAIVTPTEKPHRAAVVEVGGFWQSLGADVVVMDLSMPRLNGIEATRRIAAELPGVRVVGLSMHEEEYGLSAMRRAGAVACVVKAGPPDDLVMAIRRAAA